MTKLQINLSSRPFVNYTIYHVGYVVIGLAGLLLLAHNVFWFFSNHGDVRMMEQEIAALQAEVEDNIREAGSLNEAIETIQRNRRFREICAFVDGRIRQRRFSWIRMLNLLQEALPPDVKIESITPRVQQDSVRITLACKARKEEAVNVFIENLEGIGDFDRVSITSEDRDGSTVSFPLTMEYSPLELIDASVPGSEEPVSADREGDEPGVTEKPEPGSLAEAVSLAGLPDPDVSDFPLPGTEPDFGGETPDLFALEGEDPFAVEGNIFGDAGGLGGEASEAPETGAQGDPAPEAGKKNTQKTRSSGDLIKKPPRKKGRWPGDRS